MKIDSVTTIHFRIQSIEDIIQWLFHISPNVKDISTSITSSSEKRIGICVYFTKSNHVYSPNIEHVEIEFSMYQ